LCRRLAAVRLRYLPDDREPQPRARQVTGVGRAVEAVEDVGEILLRDPRPMVAHGYLRPRYVHVDGAAPLGGVVEEVGDGPLELGGRAADERLLQLRAE